MDLKDVYFQMEIFMEVSGGITRWTGPECLWIIIEISTSENLKIVNIEYKELWFILTEMYKEESEGTIWKIVKEVLWLYMVIDKIIFITNEVWYSIKYHLKCIDNAIDISVHFSGFETSKELLFVMTLILYWWTEDEPKRWLWNLSMAKRKNYSGYWKIILSTEMELWFELMSKNIGKWKENRSENWSNKIA